MHSCSILIPRTLLAKLFDLSAAYRQVAIAPESSWASFVTCFDPKSKSPVIFRLRALLFGAKKAVHGFLRVAYSIWFLGVVGLLLPWSDYFDDFVTFATESTAQTTDDAVSLFFRLLGCAYAGKTADWRDWGSHAESRCWLQWTQTPSPRESTKKLDTKAMSKVDDSQRSSRWRSQRGRDGRCRSGGTRKN